MLRHLWRLFVPHHSNNHKPRVLHLGPLASLISLLLIAQSGVTILSRVKPDILGFASNIPPRTVVELTNQERANNHLPALVMDEKLNDAARRKAADMIANNYWAHVSPSGTKPWAFILAAGYNYLHAGENLARDFTNAETAVAAWMASPTHRDNILSNRYKNIGVAVIDGRINGQETTLVVQMFGTPQAFSPQVNSGGTSIVKPAEAAVAAEQTTAPATVAQITEPTPTPTPAPEKTIALVETPTPVMPRLDAYWVSKALSLSFAILVMIVLAIDWLVVWRKNLVRLSGKSWAHLTYLFIMAALTLIIKQGWIL